MQLSSLASLIKVLFASSGTKNAIPDNHAAVSTPGQAAMDTGFPPITMTPVAAGGVPPYGADVNGILYAITAQMQALQAGAIYAYSSTFATAIGGYPKGAVLLKSAATGYWVTTADNNTTDPDGGSPANWSDLATFMGTLGRYIDPAPGGTANVLTGSITLPTLNAAFAGTPVYVRAGAANTVTNPSYAGKIIVKGAGSALIAGDIAGAGHWLILQYDSTLDRWVLANPAGNTTTMTVGIQGNAKNLKISALGVNNYNAVVTADEVTLENGSNAYYVARSVNLTINANGTAGQPLAPSSGLAGSTWYAGWLWYNGTTLTANLDTSATSPTPPSGYSSSDFKARVGWVRTDSTGSKYLLQILKVGGRTQYVPLAGSNLTGLPQMASGSAGSPGGTLVAVATGAYVPPSATRISGALNAASANTNAVVSPNAVILSGVVGAGTPSSGQYPQVPFDFVLESTNIYWASNSGSAILYCFGWED